MTDLETRLSDLGEHLAISDGDLVDNVLERLHQPSARTSSTWLRAAAAILLVATIATIAVPTTRNAVAGWLGFSTVTIQRLPDDALAAADAAFELAGPSDSSIEVVDGREILVSRFDARLSRPLLTKSVGTSTSVVTVDVNGRAGIWIDDGPHEIFYETDDGAGVERTAARTLLWQAGDVLFRLEGFPDLESALKFAVTLA